MQTIVLTGKVGMYNHVWSTLNVSALPAAGYMVRQMGDHEIAFLYLQHNASTDAFKEKISSLMKEYDIQINFA